MQQLIVLAGPDGIVDMTVASICARTSIPQKIIEKGIDVLEAPDPFTRTPGEDGRRIVLLDAHRPWGWRLVNHGKYMRLRNMEQKREADRLRISDKRLEISDVAIESQMSQCVANVAHSDTDTDTDVKEQKRSQGSRLPQAWQPSEPLEAWATRKRPDLDIAEMVEKFRDHWCAMSGRGGVKLDWEATFRNWIRGERVGSLKGMPAAPVTQIVRKLCAYCDRVAVGSVNGYDHCSADATKAMDGERPYPDEAGMSRREDRRNELVVKGYVVRVRFDGKDKLGQPKKLERQEGRMFHVRGAADVLCEMMKKAHPDWEVWVSERRGYDDAQSQILQP